MEIKLKTNFRAQLKLVEPQPNKNEDQTKDETCQEQTESQISSQTPSSES